MTNVDLDNPLANVAATVRLDGTTFGIVKPEHLSPAQSESVIRHFERMTELTQRTSRSAGQLEEVERCQAALVDLVLVAPPDVRQRLSFRQRAIVLEAYIAALA